MPDHLALIACGAPLAARVPEVAAAAVEAGWLVHVIATPAALAWLDHTAAEQATGHPVLTGQRQPDQAKRFPPPLTAAGVTFLDIHTGRVGTPQPIQSGTDGDITTTFDPTWPAAAARRPTQKS